MNRNDTKIELLRQIFALTQEQGALVLAEDKDSLLESLDRRQELIDKLFSLPRDEKTAAERELERKIIKLDGENIIAAQGELSHLGENSRRAREGMAAANRYDSIGDVGSTYFDRGQ